MPGRTGQSPPPPSSPLGVPSGSTSVVRCVCVSASPPPVPPFATAVRVIIPRSFRSLPLPASSRTRAPILPSFSPAPSTLCVRASRIFPVCHMGTSNALPPSADPLAVLLSQPCGTAAVPTRESLHQALLPCTNTRSHHFLCAALSLYDVCARAPCSLFGHPSSQHPALDLFW